MSRRARITRTPDPPAVTGIRADTLDGLLGALARHDVDNPVIADLTLGEWRSHELARSCFGQLEIPWPRPAPAPASTTAAAPVIGDWIDSEGRGDSAMRAALDLAETLLGALAERPLSLVVLGPRFGSAWQAESAAFFRYLAHGVRRCDRLILAGDQHADAATYEALHVQWSDAPAGAARPRPSGLMALIPGAIDPATARALDASGHPLRAGWTLVPPEWRRAPDGS